VLENRPLILWKIKGFKITFNEIEYRLTHLNFAVI